jgi:hypothetical protein
VRMSRVVVPMAAAAASALSSAARMFAAVWPKSKIRQLAEARRLVSSEWVKKPLSVVPVPVTAPPPRELPVPTLPLS